MKIATLVAALILAGCGGEPTEETASPVASQLVGSWSVVSTAIGSYPGGSVLTFGGDGTWSQVANGTTRAGTWSAGADTLTLAVDGLAPAVVTYTVAGCTRGECLSLSYAGGSTWARQ